MPEDTVAPAPSILAGPDGATLAYHRTSGQGPGVVFIHGFMSDMDGGKALHLEAWCRGRGLPFLRFDQSGHGRSSGRFEDGTIGRWAADTLAVIDALTEGPQILVGSSMGGWLMLLAARARPDRVAALVGIAAAPDFTERLIWAQMSAEERARMEADGRLEQPSEYSDSPYIITHQLILDGRKHLLLDAPLAIDCPVRLLQGKRDESVPWETALAIQDALVSQDVRATLIKDGDHRLSRPGDLDLLTDTLGALVDQMGRAESGPGTV